MTIFLGCTWKESRSSRTHLVVSFSGIEDGFPPVESSSSTLELLQLMGDRDYGLSERRGVGWGDVDKDASCGLDGGVIKPLLLVLVRVEVVMIEDTVGRNNGHLKRKGAGREGGKMDVERKGGGRTSPSLDSFEKDAVIILATFRIKNE